MHNNVDQTDPQGSDSGTMAVVRGGGYRYGQALSCRSMQRGWCAPSRRYSDIGFRVVMELSEEEFLRYARTARPS
jgi:formylglycine-generating enzyme required for sulfatase activity